VTYPPASVDEEITLVNTYAAKWTIAGWFVGLAYYNWFAMAPEHVPLLAHLVLIVGGLFASSIIIGGGMALLAALVTRLMTGSVVASPDAFAWAAFISPILAFFAAKYALKFSALF
jgi:hypothetical protein